MQQTAIISAENTGKTVFNVLYYNHNIHNHTDIFHDRFVNVVLLIDVYKKQNILGIHKLIEVIRDKNIVFLEINEKIQAFALKFVYDFLILYGESKGIQLGDIKQSGIIKWSNQLYLSELLSMEFVINKFKNNLFSYFYSRHLLETNNIPFKVFNIQNYEPGHVFTEKFISSEYNIAPIVLRRYNELTKSNHEKSVSEYINLIGDYSEELTGTRFDIDESSLFKIYDETIMRLKKLNVRLD